MPHLALDVPERIGPVSPEATTALIVAVETYDIPGPSLDGPLEDGLQFAEFLCRRGVPPQQIQVLASATPERLALARKRLSALNPSGDPALNPQLGTAYGSSIVDCVTRIQKYTRCTLLFVYWSGHGILMKENDQFLLTADATPETIRTIRLDALRARLKRSEADGVERTAPLQHQVFLIDACSDHAELNPADPNLPDRVKATEFSTAGTPVETRGQFAILAAPIGRKAKNLDGRGVFSKALLEWLACWVSENPAGPPYWPEPILAIHGVTQSLNTVANATPGIQFPRLDSVDWDGGRRSQSTGRRKTSVPGDWVRDLMRLIPPPALPSDALLRRVFKQLASELKESPPSRLTGAHLLEWCLDEFTALSPASFFKLAHAVFRLCQWPAGSLERDTAQNWLTARLADQLLDGATLFTEVEPILGSLPGSDPPQGSVLHLAVCPVNNLKSKPTFQIYAAILKPGASVSEWYPTGEPEVSADTLTAEWTRVINRLLDDDDVPDLDRVHFLVAIDQFALPLESWPIETGIGAAKPVGIEWCTGRRFLERKSQPARKLKIPYRRLNSRWTALQSGFDPGTHLVWIDDARQLGADLDAHADQFSKLAVGTVAQSETNPDRDGFIVLFNTGFPVAVWIRADPAQLSPGIEAELRGLFKGPIEQLPDRARDFRRKHASLGLHVAVLWDSPTEPLPDLPPYQSVGMDT